MDKSKVFEDEKKARIVKMAEDANTQDISAKWFIESCKHNYSYNFAWMGRPIIQFPQDILALQEIIWQVKPELIVETGIAHGGSLVFYASMIELLGGTGQVVGIDIDIRQHNRVEIEKHQMFKYITLIQGSSTDEVIVGTVRELAQGKRSVLVCLDSNHTHAHVLRELELYAPMVTKGSYLVVFDTIIEDMPPGFFPDRPWNRGNNPRTAVREFLKTTDRFEIDSSIPNKLLLTVAPDGYLKCMKD